MLTVCVGWIEELEGSCWFEQVEGLWCLVIVVSDNNALSSVNRVYSVPEIG